MKGHRIECVHLWESVWGAVETPWKREYGRRIKVRMVRVDFRISTALALGNSYWVIKALDLEYFGVCSRFFSSESLEPNPTFVRRLQVRLLLHFVRSFLIDCG